jgi:hypothetical protein
MKNGMEIRIYFECLEQAQNYIQFLIQKGLKLEGASNIPVKLVREPKNIALSELNSVRAIYSLTTPDFLITLVSNKREIPLIFGEFSEAVITEDHELQRAIGAAASAMCGAIYLKIAGGKESERSHGGIIDFNPLTVAKILKEKMDYQGYIMGNWPCIKGKKTVLMRDRENLSCPPLGYIPIAEKTLALTGIVVREAGDKIKCSHDFSALLLSELSKDKEYLSLVKGIGEADGLEELIKEWQRRATRSHPRIDVGSKEIVVKLNRFSHAADPDRGIIIFAALFTGKEKVKIRYLIKKNAIADVKRLFGNFAHQAKEEGLDENLIFALINSNHQGNHIFDATDSIKERMKSICKNKVVDCILEYCDGIVLHDKDDTIKAEIIWDRKILFNIDSASLLSFLAETKGFKEPGKPLDLVKIQDYEINEDEVTYIVVHRVLQPNNFKLVSVSYPGAQGDAAILPERERGRAQRRMYIDVIAWLPQNSDESDLALEESKGLFNQGEVEQELAKLNEIRDEQNKKRALNETILRLGETRTPRKIYIGIAFGLTDITTTWRPSIIDFIVRIIGRDRWESAHFGSALDYALKIREGEAGLPEVFKVLNSTSESGLLFLD